MVYLAIAISWCAALTTCLPARTLSTLNSVIRTLYSDIRTLHSVVRTLNSVIRTLHSVISTLFEHATVTIRLSHALAGFVASASRGVALCSA